MPSPAELIRWKHPAAKFSQQGNELDPHIAENGDKAAGLVWMEGNEMPRPTPEDILQWAEEWEAEQTFEAEELATLHKKVSAVDPDSLDPVTYLLCVKLGLLNYGEWTF